MIPGPDDLMFCILIDGEIADGANGLAISSTEQGAWERLLEPCEQWSIERAKEGGHKVRRCAIAVVNP